MGVSAIVSGAVDPVGIFFTVLILVSLVVEIWALSDAATRPVAAFVAASKQTKPIWLLILGIAVVVGAFVAWYGVFLSFFLAIAAFVAAAVYLVDVRPKVREIRRGGSSGPYGPW